jgi:hypothetical protein
MKTLLGLFMAISALTFPVSAQQLPDPLMLRGNWAGQVTQAPEDVQAREKLGLVAIGGGIPAQYPMAFEVERLVEHEHAGTVYYPLFACRIALQFEHYHDGTFYFRQVWEEKSHQTSRCAPGAVSVRFGNSPTEIFWEFRVASSTTPIARATLTRRTSLAPRQLIEQERSYAK